MKTETPYITLPVKSGKCIRTMRIWCSTCLSIAMRALNPLRNLLTKKESVSNTALPNGLWISKKAAKQEAKRKMNRLGGRWGVVKLGENYCEVEQSYFKVHNVKPVWIRRDWKWLITKR